MKKCTKCAKTKPETEFHWKKKNERRMSMCKECAHRIRSENRQAAPYIPMRKKEQEDREAESRLFNPLITSKWV